jgi:nucleoid DNA-binding protein
MTKPEIVRRLAQQSRVTHAEAADRLDRVVRDILSNLRRGKPAALPGLGQFVKAPDGSISFKPDSFMRDGGKRS